MAPTPLTVDFRLTFLYTIAGLQHKQQNYLECAASADPSGFDTVPRTGFSAAGVSGIADVFFAVLAPFYDPTNTTFDGWLLERRIGSAWVFRSSGVTTVVPTGSGAPQLGNGECISGKDTANRFLPGYIYEGGFGPAAKFSAYAPLAATTKALIDWFYNVGGSGGVHKAWAWRRSRGGAFGTRWLALVVDSNEKLRRLRHIK